MSFRPTVQRFVGRNPRLKCGRFYSEHSYVHKVYTTHEVTIEPRTNNISKIEANHLPSNSPTEDRRFMGRLLSGEKDVYCVGVVDGHAGYKCAQAVNERLLNYLSVAAMTPTSPSITEDKLDIDSLCSRVQLPGDYNDASVHLERYRRRLKEWAQTRVAAAKKSSRSPDIESAFVSAFEALDHHLVEDAIQVINPNMIRFDIDVIESALSGCCVSAVAIDDSKIVCANSGDSRAVIGQLNKDGSWTAYPLSFDHNGNNNNELVRLLSTHPESEHKTILQNGRLFGSLLPLRAFGDMLFKLNRGQMKKLKAVLDVKDFESKSLTPPYLTVTPEITSKVFEPGKDKFMVVATDGLWDFISSETAVEVVAHHLTSKVNGQTDASQSEDANLEVVNRLVSNGATRLLCHAVGQATSSNSLPLFGQLLQMIQLAPEEMRQNRDDIQVMVVYFD